MISKILILRFSSLGDIVMTTAMIRCLRNAFPKAQIDMAVREDFSDLIECNPHLNQKYYLSKKDGYQGLKKFLSTTRGHYDLVYDAHRSLRTRFLMPQVSAPYKVYFDKHYVRRSLALTLKLPILKRKRYLERFIEPLASFGVKYDGLGPEVFVPDGLGGEISRRFHLSPDKKYIGLIPSAQWPGKRWPIERFTQVALRLAKETDLDFLIFGGKADHFCEALHAALPLNRSHNFQGKLSILEGAAILPRCQVVIANDTGLLHVADAVGVPSVAILGPTSAEMGCEPFQPRSRLAEVDLWCRPCSKNGEAPCIRSERFCLSRVTVDRVTSLTLGILRETKV